MFEAACPGCGADIAPEMLCCPSCRRLVHGEELKSLAAEAERAGREQKVTEELTAWRRALELLPPDSRQYETILAKVQHLSRLVESGPRKQGRMKGALAGLGTAALFLLGKGKMLITGLTKLSTLASMLLSLGVYWSLWGWKFAAGIVVSMYIHEMGHVAMLRRYGIRATAPMFIPGLGAFVRMKQYPATAREDARVGLAGPVWGLAAALGAYGLYLVTHAPMMAAIARFGAWLNLFNLFPIWQLDGGRGYRSLTRSQRWIATAALAAAFYVTSEGLLILLLLGSLLRSFEKQTPSEPDTTGLLQYVILVAVLSWLAVLHVPVSAFPAP